MGFVRSWLLSAVALFALAGAVAAQTTNGTISGHVADILGGALPGVAVTATSPNLQGVRMAVTSVNGDYSSRCCRPALMRSFELATSDGQRTSRSPPPRCCRSTSDRSSRVGEENVVVGRRDALTQTQARDQLRAGLDRHAADQPGHQCPMLWRQAVHPTDQAAPIRFGRRVVRILFMVNGVTVNETSAASPIPCTSRMRFRRRRSPPAGVSAEFGRFSGGVINVVTKSGGNLFSGSFRDTLCNDNWRALTSLPGGAFIPNDRTQTGPTAAVAADSPYPGDVKFNHVVPTYEYTFGGPVPKDHLWFFTAGRLQDQIANRQTFVTNIPYTFTQNEKRYEANATYSANSNHRVYGAFTKILLAQTNQSQQNVMDLSSLYDASVPQDLYTLSYSGVLSPTLFVEARYNARHFTGRGAGSPFRDPINGTLLIDLSKGAAFRYWTSTFCGACPPQKLDGDDVFLKGSGTSCREKAAAGRTPWCSATTRSTTTNVRPTAINRAATTASQARARLSEARRSSLCFSTATPC